MSHKVLVVLSPGFEEVEAVTVIDILRRAGIAVVTSSLTSELEVMGSHHISVRADCLLSAADVSEMTALALPGGMRGVENMLSSDALMSLVPRFSDRVVAAVCAAPLVLDACGMLEGHRFTAHPCVHGRLRATGLDPVPAVLDGNIVTGRSAGCAMDWSLALVRCLLGELPEGLASGLCRP
ncbi:MAG: DJ-1/PfpI family protein [Proteobacteria bacterium]|nr:DJ-1/PfpI family protein [Pseudomonadota bacterium]